ncbi:MAG: hypothetical protein FWE53_00860 [Firmicutes bacterium]|nr:hypothetical protein [Bacillota bacterium]
MIEDRFPTTSELIKRYRLAKLNEIDLRHERIETAKKGFNLWDVDFDEVLSFAKEYGIKCGATAMACLVLLEAVTLAEWMDAKRGELTKPGGYTKRKNSAHEKFIAQSTDKFTGFQRTAAEKAEETVRVVGQIVELGKSAPVFGQVLRTDLAAKLDALMDKRQELSALTWDANTLNDILKPLVGVLCSRNEEGKQLHCSASDRKCRYVKEARMEMRYILDNAYKQGNAGQKTADVAAGRKEQNSFERR